MRIKLFLLMVFTMLLYACDRKEAVNPIIDNAIIIASRQYVFSYINDNVDDYEYVYFEKKFQDKEISIFEFSSRLKSYNDTLFYSKKYSVMNVDVYVRDFANSGNEMIIKDQKYNEFAFYDPSIAILIVNELTGRFKVVNFGQQYMTFAEMMCFSIDIINSLKE